MFFWKIQLTIITTDVSHPIGMLSVTVLLADPDLDIVIFFFFFFFSFFFFFIFENCKKVYIGEIGRLFGRPTRKKEHQGEAKRMDIQKFTRGTRKGS